MSRGATFLAGPGHTTGNTTGVATGKQRVPQRAREQREQRAAVAGSGATAVAG